MKWVACSPCVFIVHTLLILTAVVPVPMEAKALQGKPKTSKIITNKQHSLIVVSFDGFRWDYLTRTSTPNFDRFLKNGVTARYGLRNAFVTKTFPNHFTLVTGLWEESHGIVGNDMYDPVLNQTFSISNVSATEDPAWFSVGAEPIWVTNQLQTLGGRSGVMMWVGGGAPIKWVTPSRFVAYNASVRNETKIEMLLDWFTDPYPINLGLMYFDQPDGVGHTYGPESAQVTDMIGGLDTVVGYLLQRLEEEGLLESTNIILTSDHGFTSTPENKTINLDDFIDSNSYNVYGLSPVANIWPHNGKLEEIYQNLTAAANLKGTFCVYKKEDIPTSFHFTNSRRIPPILVIANDTYSFCTGKCVHYSKGDHGYDNRLQDMHPFFLAMGPSFKKNVSVDTFDNVDVYPLMCHLLGLQPAPNNGTLEVVSQFLVLEGQEDPNILLVTYIFVAIILVSISGLFIISASRNCAHSLRAIDKNYTTIVDRPYESATSMESNISRVDTGMGSLDARSKNRVDSGAGSLDTRSKLLDAKVPLLQDQDDSH